MDDTYQTIAKPATGLYKEKGSKFIALAYPVESEEEVKKILSTLRKEYHDARHHCYAYVLGPKGEKWRENDDGEPSGTAGKPIHGQLIRYNLTDILVVVIRYFGGTKLGVSGLINAYKTATNDALSQTEIITKTVNKTFRIDFGYSVMNDIMRILKEYKPTIKEQQLDNSCSILLSVRESQAEEFLARIGKVEGISIDKHITN